MIKEIIKQLDKRVDELNHEGDVLHDVVENLRNLLEFQKLKNEKKK